MLTSNTLVICLMPARSNKKPDHEQEAGGNAQDSTLENTKKEVKLTFKDVGGSARNDAAIVLGTEHGVRFAARTRMIVIRHKLCLLSKMLTLRPFDRTLFGRDHPTRHSDTVRCSEGSTQTTASQRTENGSVVAGQHICTTPDANQPNTRGCWSNAHRPQSSWQHPQRCQPAQQKTADQ